MASIDDTRAPPAKRPRLQYKVVSPPDLDESDLEDQIQEQIQEEIQEQIQEEIDFVDKIEALETKVVCLEQKIEELKSSTDEKQTQTKDLISQVEELKTNVTKLEEELKEKNASISEMQQRINSLEESINEYERDRNKLYLCQVAVEFEHAICCHILPEVFKNDDFATIKRLLKIINGNGRLPFNPSSCNDDNKKMLIGARKRWKDLCENLKLPEQWKTEKGDTKFNFYDPTLPEIFRAIQLLKCNRNPVAHPTPVSIRRAVEICSNSQRTQKDHWQFQLIQNFIPSLSEMIKDCGIRIDRNKLEL